MDLTNPGRALVRFSRLSISLKLSTLSGIPPFSTNSFWLAEFFASTHSLMLPSASLKEALLTCFPLPPCNLPSSTVESTFPLHAPALITLSFLPWLFPLYDLVLWTDGSVPFSFGKNGSGVLANCSLYSTEATLFFSAGPACSCSAEACTILQALCWSGKQQQTCHFSSSI